MQFWSATVAIEEVAAVLERKSKLDRQLRNTGFRGYNLTVVRSYLTGGISVQSHIISCIYQLT